MVYLKTSRSKKRFCNFLEVAYSTVLRLIIQQRTNSLYGKQLKCLISGVSLNFSHLLWSFSLSYQKTRLKLKANIDFTLDKYECYYLHYTAEF